MSDQIELFAVPTPTRTDPGRCRVPTRFGSVKPCGRTAEGTAAEWTAPLDPAARLGSCQECADVFGLVFTPF
ncbi:hypothetical protein [Microlunatus antarcticus]|uniref:Uncharacterized protein n=1 Tax=Microlunatus antarcticus TaxID=53388 RepID=A0A7W5P7S8_9ACTN|nr:hypothetical protein [Microlunatus antarcticus]MBB3327860.1 hypothetical protein [Microlunatus antarcticus]